MKKLPIVALLAAWSIFGADFSIGIRIGPPPPPRVVHVLPPSPGPDFVWVDGYWYPADGRYRWHEGYWTRSPYPEARWIGPRYEGGQFFEGYWEGPRGRIGHDHHWDREHDRDFRRGGDHDRDRH